MPCYRVTVTYEEEIEADDAEYAERYFTEDVEHGRYSPVAVDVEVIRRDK